MSVLREGFIVEKEALKRYEELTKRKVKLLGDALTIIEDERLIRFGRTKFKISLISHLPQHFYGIYHHNDCLLEIDPRQMRKQFVTVLCHELVHAEQAYDGRLLYYSGSFYWKGQEYDNSIQPPESASAAGRITHWFALPWEREAYLREGELAETVLFKM